MLSLKGRVCDVDGVCKRKSIITIILFQGEHYTTPPATLVNGYFVHYQILEKDECGLYGAT